MRLRTANKRYKNRYWKARATISRLRGGVPFWYEAKALGMAWREYEKLRDEVRAAAVRLCGTGPWHRKGGLFKEPPRRGWAKKGSTRQLPLTPEQIASLPARFRDLVYPGGVAPGAKSSDRRGKPPGRTKQQLVGARRRRQDGTLSV
jgi:hypothetical protein